jgi:L-malate glycosyltransferase
VKIAFVYDLVYPYSKGGVEKRIWDLAHLLSARGHDVDIVGIHSWDGPAETVLDGIRFRGVAGQTGIHTRTGRRSIAQAMKFAFSSGRALAGSHYDIVEVQAMAPLSCLGALAICRVTGAAPVVAWYEVWRDYWNDYLGTLGYLGQLIEWLVAKLAPVNSAASGLAATRLKMLGARNVSLIPIGIDVASIRSIEAATEKTDILYVGRLMSHKNLELLIDSVALLKTRGIEPRVSVVGEGPQREALVQRAAHKSLHNISFKGRIESHEQVLSMMKSSQVFAFPSKREGFGLAALEAASCGLPIVAIAHQDNATTELIEDGVNGVISTATASDFSDSLGRLLGDRELLDRMGREAMARAESFDWGRIADQAERFYEDCLPLETVDANQSAG